MKSNLILLVLLLLGFPSFAQDTTQVRIDTVRIETIRVDTVYVPQAQPTKATVPVSTGKNEKVYYGGYANFSLGKYSIIGFEPMIGYKLLPKFSVGGKLSYEHFKNKNYSPTQSGSNWGIGAFSRLRISRRLYAHVEFSEMNYKLFQDGGETSNREWISFLFVGGGFIQPISKGVSLNAEVLWDVIQNKNSPYNTVEPVFNVGVGIGF